MQATYEIEFTLNAQKIYGKLCDEAQACVETGDVSNRKVSLLASVNKALDEIIAINPFDSKLTLAGCFPESLLYLELMSDPEGVDPDQLFVYISTDLPPREARPKLKALDHEWWLDAVGRAQGKLCISLEYQ